MSKQAYEKWYVEGLQALKSAGQQGHEAAGATLKAVKAPEVKTIVEEDTAMAERHAKTIDELLRKSGGSAEGKPNKIMEGIRAGNKQVVEAANDDEVRDASVIAAAQIALHYYVAAYGTLAATAKHLGKEEDARMLKEMTDESKRQDEKFSHVSKEIAARAA